jgi:hypothetical protein
MNRRFEMGPLLVALGALLLLVSLFLDWYGPLSAWDAFEVVDVLLAALAVLSLVGALGTWLPDVAYVERRWLPGIVLAVVVLVAAEIIDPPPAAADLSPDTGAWIALGAAAIMLVGAVLTLGRVSVSVAVEEREFRHRVSAVDERQQTTDSAAVVPPATPDAPAATATPAATAADPATDPSTAPTVPDAEPPGRSGRKARR